jgi:hypothetical protein
MDFIERVFHVAPDGGTGFLELASGLVILIALLVAAVFRNKRSCSA